MEPTDRPMSSTTPPAESSSPAERRQVHPHRRRASDMVGHPLHNVAERAALLVQRTHPAAWLWLSLALVALDQATKFLVTRFLDLYERVEVLPVLDFTLLHNTGAAFSFLADASGWQRGFFITLGIGVSLALVVWLWRLPRGERLLPIALALIVGGAVGNVIDRIVHGHVIDFIHAHWGAAYFPAFNIADSGITIGAALLLLDAFREHRN
jgi:signal peptidase II